MALPEVGDDATELDLVYEDLRCAQARIETLEAALRFLFEETKWKSVDKDNMEFEGHVTLHQLDKARTALAPEQDK